MTKPSSRSAVKSVLIEKLSGHSFKLLLYALKSGGVKVSDARLLGMGYSTFYRNLIPLIELGLLREAKVVGSKKIYMLTNLGKDVALKLKEIDGLLVSYLKSMKMDVGEVERSL